MFPLRDKSKKLAEQASAIVCLRVLGLPEGRIGEDESGLVCKRKREASVVSDGGKEDRSKKRHAAEIQMETTEAAADRNSDLKQRPAEPADSRNHEVTDDKTEVIKSVETNETLI